MYLFDFVKIDFYRLELNHRNLLKDMVDKMFEFLLKRRPHYNCQLNL